MKGEKIVTNLLPYGPEKPRLGMVKEGVEGNPGTTQIEIFWDPPRGEFTKYFLNIEKVSEQAYFFDETSKYTKNTNTSNNNSVLKNTNILNLNSYVHETSLLTSDDKSTTHTPVRVVQNLNNKLTSYTILGLQPGEQYAIELGTITGAVSTRQTIRDIIMTKPMPPDNVCASNITTTSCKVSWSLPGGHSCLKGFQIKVKLDSETVNNVTVPKTNTYFTINSLNPGRDYDIYVTSLCTTKENARTESDAEQVAITTSLESVMNLTLESATSDSISIKWEPRFVSEKLKYKLKIESVQDEQVWIDGLGSKMEQIKRKVRLEREGISFDEEKNKVKNFTRTVKAIAGDQKSHEFAELPDFFGAGFPYVVSIIATCKTKNGKEAASDEVSKVFQTKPYPPSKLEVENRNIQWSPSLTPHVNEYHISWTQIGINGHIVKSWTNEIITKDIRIPVNDAKQICNLPKDYDHHFCAGYIFKFEVSAVVNIRSLGIESESESVGGTFIVAENGELELYTERPESPTNMSEELF